MMKALVMKIIKTLVVLVIVGAATVLGLTSCTATRVVTTSASYVTHGDTTTTIMTKTVETYQGKKEGVL